MVSPILKFRVPKNLLKIIEQLKPYLMEEYKLSSLSECCRHLLVQGIKLELQIKARKEREGE